MLLNLAILLQETTNATTQAAPAGSTTPATAPAQAPGFDLTAFLPLVILFAIFYFLIIRPQRKEQKKRMEMISQLKKGDKVMTTGGMYGTIVNLKDDEVTLEVDDNVRIRFTRAAISQTTTSDSKEPELAKK